ncbi:MAG: (d)CMP kinase [Flavobacteriales bacterium]|nr:(d)CMP kinase [Flavobacteriales bacterium]
MGKKINIAVDGHSSTGKSTLAKQLAKKLRYRYIDTGAMYRAVTLYALNAGIAAEGKVNEKALIKVLPDINIDFDPDKGANHALLNGVNVEGEIRAMQVSKHVSHVAKIAEVRTKLREMQQKAAAKGGVVMDGRDIGSAVLPNAELKIFMTADPKVRTKRRYDELHAKGNPASMEEVRQNISERDRIDTGRKENPLIRVDDALLLDNSRLTQEEQLEIALDWAHEVIEKVQ